MSIAIACMAAAFTFTGCLHKSKTAAQQDSTCTQRTLRNATLYLGNTAAAGPDAIVATGGSSLFRPLPNGTTEFDISFTLLRPGLLHSCKMKDGLSRGLGP